MPPFGRTICNMQLELARAQQTFGPFSVPYTFRDAALYALAVGAGPDELDYVVESERAKVLPAFAVVPSVAPIFVALRAIGADETQMLHMAHRLELFAPFPRQGVTHTEARITRVGDMGMGALVTIEAESRIADVRCARNVWTVLLRGQRNFGGARPMPMLRTRPPEGVAPAFEVVVATRPEQALLYRLTGDLNPVHAHPEAARRAGFERPILHGLCVFGIAVRAAMSALAPDSQRFRACEARFGNAAIPGDELLVRGYPLTETDLPDARHYALTVSAGHSEVIGNAVLELAHDA